MLMQRQMSTYIRDELLWTWQLGRDGTTFFVYDNALIGVGPDLAVRWRVPSTPSLSISQDGFTATDDGDVIVASGHGLTAYNREAGERWTTDLHTDGYLSRPVVGRDGMLYALGSNWILYAVRPPARR